MTEPIPPTEDRLRAALDAHARTVNPSPDGLDRIEERLMTPSRNTRTYAIVGGVAALVLLVVGLVLLTGDDDEPEPSVAAEGTTTTSEGTTTSATDGEPSEPFAPTTDPSLVVFPAVDSSQRFDTPEAAAFAFATEYAGFVDPELSEFRQGDSRSGEMEVSRRPGTPVSTILLRQLDDDTWGVIGAEADSITKGTPGTGDVVTSPVEVTGFGLAFEGTINVDVREQGRTRSIGDGFVTAGGSPPGDDYSGEVEYSTPSTRFGAIVYREFSAEDGTTSWVSVTRVEFGDADPEGAAEGFSHSCGSSDPAGDDEVLVFFTCTEDAPSASSAVPVARPGGGGSAVLRAAIEALLQGPDEADRARGLSSPFPVAGATLLGVTIDDGLAVIDLSGNVADEVPGGATTAGIALRQQLFFTATQFDTVDAVELHFDGSCDAAKAWAEADSCRIRPE